MNDARFYKKKQLLAQRDKLLEEIGQTLFERKELPAEFQSLAQEFHNMDILLGQLRDRYRSLREDRDRVHLDYSELLNEQARIEDELSRELKPHRRDFDEISLKLQYQKDEIRRGSKRSRKQGELERLEHRLKEINDHIKEIEEERKEVQEDLRNKIEPLAARLKKWNVGIRKIQEEEEHLSSNRKSRLRDLGYCHYTGKPDDPNFAAKYGRLDLLRMELADTTKSIKHIEPEMPKKQERGNWGWLFLFSLVAIWTGYRYRTQFSQEDVPLLDIASAFLSEEPQYRLFANMTRVNNARLKVEIPDLEMLPGGMVFKGISAADINAILVARQGAARERLQFFGMKLRRAPTRFSLRLRQRGWTHLPSNLKWRALTDGQWVWLILNDHAYFLLRREALAGFEALTIPNPPEILFKDKIEAFGNNRPLLQGLNLLELTLDEKRFQIEIRSLEPLPDWDDRVALLEALTQDRPANQIQFQLQNGKLLLAGPRESFTPTNIQNQTLREFVMREIGLLVKRNSLPIVGRRRPSATEMIAGKMAIPLPANPRQRLMMYEHQRGALRLVDDLSIGIDLCGMAFQRDDESLLVADQAGHALYKLRIVDSRLVTERYRLFAGAAKVPGDDLYREDRAFSPAFISVAPGEPFAVVLEREPASPGSPKLLLLRTSTLEVVGEKELPRGADFASGAAWDAAGQTLFVGCSSKEERLDNAPGVVIYHRNGHQLLFTHYIDLPVSPSGRLEISGLAVESVRRELYFLRFPGAAFTRYTLERFPAGEIGTIYLRDSHQPRGLTTNETPFSALALNRTNTFALVALASGLETTGRSLLHLVDLSGTKSTLIDTLDIEMVPSAMLRIPLSDRFWVAGKRARGIAQVKIGDNLLSLEDRFYFDDFEPAYLACDPWGRYLFIAGKNRDQKK